MREVAYIGAIKALEEENIKIDCIIGSMGIMMYELYDYEMEGIEYLLKCIDVGDRKDGRVIHFRLQDSKARDE